ncbi:acetyltransferase [Streptomyces sp. CB02923]|uniref:GNAT family N-acetyltransferase n=1 Tax=Streptomyces sp. CB02923 TaxID=1718985 RepID=UPI0009403C9C|nr:GNAT family N-acetyltransferase [Streptomyces sp. CB02923]OKH98281.1 acetyltransferase [Streptomyces sp. CB02923]
MTTTLRPAGPEERRDDGGRARTYEVCVNSRPVGRIRLVTDARLGLSAGRIADLHIDERDRHRGRGTVAALAAEEVLRGWGCRRVSVDVPAASAAALQLAAALGYTEHSRRMIKELTTAPGLPAGSADRPLGAEEYPAWLAATHTHSIDAQVANGMPRERAEHNATHDHRTLLPDGPATAHQSLRVLAHDGTDVGTVWTSTYHPDRPGGYVMDVRVAPEHRGRGHGRTLMLVAERETLAAGRTVLGLDVFVDNPRARGLYETLGYRPTDYSLRKLLL